MKMSEFGKFLVSGPLYQNEVIEDPEVGRDAFGNPAAPETLDKDCPGRECGRTKWESLDTLSRGLASGGGDKKLSYGCRNCQASSFTVWLGWTYHHNKLVVVKVGQTPKIEISIPKDFEKALGGRRELYTKGMTLRHNAYGIGALTYFRRLIEDTTDAMLDLVIEALKATGDSPDVIAKIQGARNSKRFEDRVKIVADVLPASLRPGGANPFSDLYELLSIGLHDKSDEDCCEIVDGMDTALKFIYTQIKAHTEAARSYQGAVKAIRLRVDKLKSKAVPPAAA